MTEGTPKILVMGIGNPLMQDEGVGVRVVERLMAGYEFPADVEVVDAGTMGFTILNLLRDRERVLVLDAIDGTEEPPGTVMVLEPEAAAARTVFHSLHDTRLVDVLQAAELTGTSVQATLVGVQIQSMEQWVLELTPGVEAALPAATEAALEVLRDWGVEPVPSEGGNEDARVISALRTFEPMPGDRVSDEGAADAQGSRD